MKITTRAILAAIAVLCTATSAVAQQEDPLKAAAAKALATNPDVSARLNAYRASVDAIDVARAAYRPRLDLSANVGRDSDSIITQTPQSRSISRTGASLNLSQLLWDGLGTQREVERTGHDKLARYFELLDTTEQTALEAARAYYDVLRYRRLVQLAEDNYVQHKYASLQIQSRFKAGVGRGVDLEQANARLALAESNLSTEVANLHDVTARYQRIVGEAPPKQMPTAIPMVKSVPATSDEAMSLAIRQNASISASIEALRGTRSMVEERRSLYQPRIEARLRSGAGRNFDGILDQQRFSSAEIVLNWNLYNGGADQAHLRQQVSLMTQAEDQRDKACRDTRQLVAVAYNDTRKLVEQIELLDRNTIAIEKARDAYRQQFDIGQRSLLDLLNAENEVYTARRAYANAEYDLAIAYVRTLAEMSSLTSQLGLARLDAVAAEAANWSAGEDAPGRCPVLIADVTATDRALLDERARRIVDSLSPATPPAPANPKP